MNNQGPSQDNSQESGTVDLKKLFEAEKNKSNKNQNAISGNEKPKPREPTELPTAFYALMIRGELKDQMRLYLDAADPEKAESGDGQFLHGETRNGSNHTFHIRFWQESNSQVFQTEICEGKADKAVVGTKAYWGPVPPSAEQIVAYYKTWAKQEKPEKESKDPFKSGNANNKGKDAKKAGWQK